MKRPRIAYSTRQRADLVRPSPQEALGRLDRLRRSGNGCPSPAGSEGTGRLGNVTQTHLLEQALRGLILPIAFLRVGSLLENNLQSLGRAASIGVFGSFPQPVDRAVPMAATRGVGNEAARLLIEERSGHRAVEVGSRYSPSDLARASVQVS